MSPTHAVKNGKRYRYYVSHGLITGARAASPDAQRVPAPEIEQLVADRIRQFLADPGSVTEAADLHRWDPGHQQQLIDCAAEVAGSWAALPPLRTRVVLTTLVQRIDLHPDAVAVTIYPGRLPAVLGIGAAVHRVLRLSYLAPDITRAILEGRQPPGLTARTLVGYSDLPLDWPAQRKALGFV